MVLVNITNDAADSSRFSFVRSKKVRMTAKKLASWTMTTATSAAAVAYTLYDIHANGEVIGGADISGNGVIDAVAVDVDNVAGAEFVLRDTDGNGLFDMVSNIDPDGTIAETVAEGGVFEMLLKGVASVLDWFS